MRRAMALGVLALLIAARAFAEGAPARNVAKATKRMLSDTQVEGLLARRDFIVKYFEARIAEIGESQVLYDLPPRVNGQQVSR